MNKRKHVHLGERLQAIESVRSGRLTAEQAAAQLEVTAGEVHEWMQIHSNDRIVSLDEARVSPEAKRLSKRAERLVELIAAADLTIRVLNRMLTESAAPREA
jgi:DNA-directed RNA polymerase specialized sigma subunit